jgi:hypothetical protein
MTNPPDPEPRDPAEVLKKHYRTVQAPGSARSTYVMSDRNKEKLERIRELVRRMRGFR